MSTVWNVIKINVLSLLALPLLLIAIVVKLLQKAMEKVLVFLGVGAAILGLFLLNSFFNNPSGFFEGLGVALIFLIVFGFIVAVVAGVLVLFGGIAATVLMAVVSTIMAVLGVVFEFSHESYSKLYDICKTDFDLLQQSKEGNNQRFFCVLWYILKYLNKAVVMILSVAFPISLAAAFGFAAYSVFYVNQTVLTSFGIGIFSYLKLFPTTNVVFTVLNFSVLVIAIVVVIISLGIEWNEWGRTLKISTQNYGEYREAISRKAREFDSISDGQYSFEEGKSSQRCQQYMELLHEMFENLESLRQQVDSAMYVKYDSSLAYAVAEHIELLGVIFEELSSFKGNIPCAYFEHKLIPMIDIAKKQEKDIENGAFSILNKGHLAAQKQKGAIDFFGGCSTQEEIKQRHKALCKIYHPDVGGHEDTFKQLQNQYEEKLLNEVSL